jgi:hypothetical protein
MPFTQSELQAFSVSLHVLQKQLQHSSLTPAQRAEEQSPLNASSGFVLDGAPPSGDVVRPASALPGEVEFEHALTNAATTNALRIPQLFE